MNLTDNAKAVLVLTTRLGERNRPSLTALMWDRVSTQLAAAGVEPSAVFDSPGLADLGLDPQDVQRVDELLDSAPAVTLDLERIEAKGIWHLTVLDGEYPQRLRALGGHAPPVVFGVGPRTLLDDPTIGIVGSRDVHPDGARIAREIALEAPQRGLTLVSGGAKGVDQIGMAAANEEGGAVVGVVADSLEERIKKADIREALDAGRTCLVTIQHPAAGFSPGAAMARNKIVYALSDLTVVVASAGGSGGTWAGAIEALRLGVGRVAVWRGPGEGPGNEKLEKAGATPFSDTEALWEVLAIPPEPDPEQLSMGLGG